MKKQIILTLALFASCTAINAAIVTQIDFNTDGPLFVNQLGAPLSAGGQANGDGFLYQLGYFSTATTANNFSGTWVPLTGEGSLNSDFASSRIGDGDGADGEVYASFTFDTGVSTRGSALPSSNAVPLSIRFYNASTIAAATFYNTVSNDLWLWKSPATPAPLPPTVFMSLTDPGLAFESVDVNGQTLGASQLRTTIPVPEPTSAFLVAVGAAGLMMRRRRQS